MLANSKKNVDDTTQAPPPRPKRKTRESVTKQREKWRQDKQAERKKWSSQKWRRHRERCAAYNKQRRLTSSEATGIPTTFSGTQSGNPVPGVSTPTTPTATPKKKHDVNSPSPQRLKAAYKARLHDLKKSRTRDAALLKKLLHDLVDTSATPDKADLYKRKKSSPASKAALNFLNDVAVDIPGKRSVSKKTGQQKKILPKRLRRLHRDFCQKFPDKKVSLRTFYRLLPNSILTSRKQVFRQCLCEICANIDLQLDAVNKIITVPIDGRDELSEMSLCPQPTLSCLQRKCKECGVQKIRCHIDTHLVDHQDQASPATWKSWQMVQTERGKRRELIQREGTMKTLINELLKELHSFSQHLFTFRWQHHQLKTIQTSLPPKWAIVIMDFAENFLCRYQDEVQSAHWGYNQVTVHPCVLYYQCPNCVDLVTDYLIFLSDDLSHDAHMVQVIQKQTKQHLAATMGQLDKMVIFSDGCAAQYKSKLPFHYLANSAAADVAVERCYFGSRHGKSPCDACGGVIKRLVEDDILSGSVIQNAASMYQHCCGHFVLSPESNLCCHTRRSFRLIQTGDIDRSVPASSLTTVPGTRQFHCLKRQGRNALKTRKLSCFCNACILDKPEDCANKMFVDTWKVVKLGGIKTASVQNASVPDVLPRLQYFSSLLEKMTQCTTFQQLQKVVSKSKISLYSLPDCWPKTILDVAEGRIDAMALTVRPDTVPPHLYPLQTTADGNCLPNCISMLVFGDETHQEEIRCRIVAELVQNREIYTEGRGMGGLHVAARVATLSPNFTLDCETATVQHTDAALKAEIMQIKRPGESMGLWQLAAVSNILAIPVDSFYPKLGWREYQELNSRTLLPQHKERDGPLRIMWSTNRTDMTRDHWTANHFVPLVPLVDPEASVSVEITVDPSVTSICESSTEWQVEPNDFCTVEWEGQEYVAQVLEVDREEEMVKLSFMESRKGFYVWPLQEDLSWERVRVLKEKVEMEINALMSNQRMQFFEIKK